MTDGLSIYRTLAPGGAVHVKHVPADTFRHQPSEHYEVQAGPGVTYLTPDGLDDLIEGLIALRKRVADHAA